MPRLSFTAALVVVTAPLFASPPVAEAQIPIYQLPKDDFVWHWGRSGEQGEQRGFVDLEVSGGEAQFRCELTAKLRGSSTMTPQDINQIENELRTRLDFVYAASEAMNSLEQEGTLEWAMLDCKQSQAKPLDEAERAEREDRAREKMQREIERRRARNAPNGAAE